MTPLPHMHTNKPPEYSDQSERGIKSVGSGYAALAAFPPLHHALHRLHRVPPVPSKPEGHTAVDQAAALGKLVLAF